LNFKELFILWINISGTIWLSAEKVESLAFSCSLDYQDIFSSKRSPRNAARGFFIAI